MNWLTAQNPIVLWCLSGLWASLIIITLMIFIAVRDTSQKTELRARVLTWWAILSLMSVGLLTGPMITLILFAIISFLALKEYFSMIPTRRVDRSVLFWAYLAIPIQYYFIAISWYGMFIIFIPVYLFLLLPAIMVLRGQTDGFLKAAGTVHWGVMLCVFAISHAAFLLEGLDIGAQENHGFGAELFIYLLILTAMNDVMQYTSGKMLGGRLFGRSKIAPRVSPNKTWEGFLGGLFSTTTLAVLLNFALTPLTMVHAVLLGILLAGAGLLGDLVISALKRDLGLKDSGSLLPGHGGILDRIDSLIFTAPLFLHFVRYFYF